VRRRLSLSFELPAAPAEVFAGLTSYARLIDWVPGLRSARVLAREGDIAVLELVTDGTAADPCQSTPQAQHGRAEAPAGSPLVLEIVETMPERLSFTQVDRFRGDGVSGTCELRLAAPDADHDSDRSSRPTTALDLSLSFECTAIEWLGARRAARHRLEAAGESLATRLAGPAAESPGSDQETAPTRVLEIRRHGEQLVLFIDGQHWRLEPVDRS